MKMNITPFEDKLKEHLDQLAKKDKTFAKKYKNEKKSIKECAQYIIGEVQKQCKGKNTAVPKEEVYGLAVHYYDEENIKVDTSAKAVVATSPKAASKVASKKTTKKKAEKDVEYTPMSLEIPLFG